MDKDEGRRKADEDEKNGRMDRMDLLGIAKAFRRGNGYGLSLRRQRYREAAKDNIRYQCDLLQLPIF